MLGSEVRIEGQQDLALEAGDGGIVDQDGRSRFLQSPVESALADQSPGRFAFGEIGNCGHIEV